MSDNVATELWGPETSAWGQNASCPQGPLPDQGDIRVRSQRKMSCDRCSTRVPIA